MHDRVAPVILPVTVIVVDDEMPLPRIEPFVCDFLPFVDGLFLDDVIVPFVVDMFPLVAIVPLVVVLTFANIVNC